MTFDDGYGSEMRGSSDDFRSSINTLLQEEDVSFSEVCKLQGLSADAVKRALEDGTYGLPKNMAILNQFLRYFNLNVDWLLSQEFQEQHAQNRQRYKVRKVTWDFILADSQFPWQHRMPLIEYIMAMTGVGLKNTIAVAARRSPPRTLLDVANIYRSLKRQNYFGKR